MKNAFVIGCNGSLGKVVCALINDSKEFEFSNGIGYDNRKTSFKNTALNSVKDLKAHDSWLLTKDVFIDVSDSQATMDVLPFAMKHEIPMVIISAGFTLGKKAVIKAAARKIAIFVLDKKTLLAQERNIHLVLLAASYIIKQQDQIKEQTNIGQQSDPYIYTLRDLLNE